MRRATILDLAEILDLMSGVDSGARATSLVRAYLREPSCYVFLSDDNKMCFALYPAANDIYDMHIYTKMDRKPAVVKKFGFACVRWMIENRIDPQGFINVVQKEDKHLMMFMKYVGSKRISKLPNGNVIYFSSIELLRG